MDENGRQRERAHMNAMVRTRRIVARLVIAGAGVWAWALPAQACGGFFCRQLPVDQAGEKVLFVTDGQTVDATIQIQFTGQAKDFSWVVPLLRKPISYAVSSDEVFSLLGRNTMPRYILDWQKPEGSCPAQPLLATGRAEFMADDVPAAGSGVVVVEKGEVGNYSFVLLSSADPNELETWLKDNGYNVPADFDEKAETYIRGKYVFLALKLLEGKTTGDLQPIRLQLDEESPCVPIRLTAVAATPNMPVILYAFGPGRAVPRNYRHVRLNETLLDWIGASPQWGFGGIPALPAPNYDDVVNKSMDEAGGRGFVTEMATASAGLFQLLQNRATAYDTSLFQTTMTPRQVIQEVARQGYPTGPALQSIIDRHLPPMAATEAWSQLTGRFFGSVPAPTDDAGTETDVPLDQAKLDVLAFAKDLEAMFAAPMREAAALTARAPWVTRLYTTMSPDEMTEDPIFGFNPRLPQVNNRHIAEATPVCPDGDPSRGGVRIKLEDGTTYLVPGDGQLPPLARIPAAAVIEMLDEVADRPSLVSDRGPVIRAALADWQAGRPIGTTPANAIPGSPTDTSGKATSGQSATGATRTAVSPGCACSNPVQTGSDPTAADREGAFWGVALGAVAAWRLRRPRRPGRP